jgi:hypothetical protein
MFKLLRRIFSKENLFAILEWLAPVAAFIVVFTSAVVWISSTQAAQSIDASALLAAFVVAAAGAFAVAVFVAELVRGKPADFAVKEIYRNIEVFAKGLLKGVGWLLAILLAVAVLYGIVSVLPGAPWWAIVIIILLILILIK